MTGFIWPWFTRMCMLMIPIYIACATNAKNRVNRTNYTHEGCWFSVGYIYISNSSIIAKRMFITFAQRDIYSPLSGIYGSRPWST